MLAEERVNGRICTDIIENFSIQMSHFSQSGVGRVGGFLVAVERLGVHQVFVQPVMHVGHH